MRSVVNRDYTVINGVIIVKGKIIGNPFALGFMRTQASQWMLNNEHLVKNTIRKNFTDFRLGESVDDCFRFGLDYFMQRDRVFDSNYSKDGTDYDIGKYVMGNLKYVVISYRREFDMNEPDDSVFSLSEEYTTQKMHYSMNKVESNVGTLEDNYVDLNYLNSIFDESLALFNQFLRGNKYIEFNSSLFIYTLFMDIRYNEVTEQLGYVSEKIDKPIELVESIVSKLKSDYTGNIPTVKKIFTLVLELQQTAPYGFIPNSLSK